jgi:hypothetical protein
MNDHNLYAITHSGSFSNLKVLDLRGNNLKFPMTLKVNFHKFDVPLLEELYLKFYLEKSQNEVKNKKNLYNFSTDISFVFSDLIPQLNKLKVLWLKGVKHQLIVSEFKIQNLEYRKLHLDNVQFIDKKGNELLENLGNCKELALLNCESKEEISAELFGRMNHLKILNISDSPQFYKSAMNSEILQNNLETLKINKIDDKKINKTLLRFKNLGHLRLANVEFLNSLKDVEQLLPVFFNIKTFEVIRCKLSGEFIKLIGSKGMKISKLTYIDNQIVIDKKSPPNFRIKLNFVSQLTC